MALGLGDSALLCHVEVRGAESLGALELPPWAQTPQQHPPPGSLGTSFPHTGLAWVYCSPLPAPVCFPVLEEQGGAESACPALPLFPLWGREGSKVPLPWHSPPLVWGSYRRGCSEGRGQQRGWGSRAPGCPRAPSRGGPPSPSLSHLAFPGAGGGWGDVSALCAALIPPAGGSPTPPTSPIRPRCL